MRRFLILSLIIGTLTMQGCAGQKINVGKVLDGISKSTQGGGLTNDEIISGLKQALQVGINKGADSASKVNGYFLNPGSFVNSGYF